MARQKCAYNYNYYHFDPQDHLSQKILKRLSYAQKLELVVLLDKAVMYYNCKIIIVIIIITETHSVELDQTEHCLAKL